MKTRIGLFVVAIVALFIAGCGGGGGGSQVAVPPPVFDNNTTSPPVFDNNTTSLPPVFDNNTTSLPPVFDNNTTSPPPPPPITTTSRISGRVSTPSGIGISNVPIVISGTSTTSVLTDAEGKFSVTLPNGNYTLLPMPEEYTLNPLSVSTVLSADTVRNFTATLNFSGTPAGSPEALFGCPTDEEIAAIKADIGVNFFFDPTSSQTVCGNLTPLQKHVYGALKYMKTVRFNTALPWTDASLWDWFKGSVREIDFWNQSGSSYVPPGTYYTLGALSISSQASMGQVVFDKFVEPTGGGLYSFIGLLVHEARHAQKLHTCGLRDVSLSMGGAYAAQYYILGFMAENSNFALTSAQKNEIQVYADFIKSTQFCVQE